MTSPDGAFIPPDPDAYTLPQTSKAHERLMTLYASDPALFWFFKDVVDPTQVQFESRYDDVNVRFPARPGADVAHPMLMELGCTTIASDPENKLNEDVFMELDLTPVNDIAATPEVERARKLVTVIDGASSQLPIAALEKHGVSGAFYISHLIKYGFGQSDVYNELRSRQDLTAKDIVIAMNGWIHSQLEQVEGVNYADAATIPGAAATFALVDFPAAKVTLAHIADTVAVQADSADYNQDYQDTANAQLLTNNRNKRFDDETAALVEQIMGELSVDRPTAVKDPRVKEQLRASFRRKINTPDGCGILNGMPELVTNDLIQEHTIDLIEAHQKALPNGSPLILVLASDGFYSIFDTNELGEPDAAKIAEFGEQFKGVSYRGRNFATIVEEVRSQFVKDKALENPPRLKLVDDITLATMKIAVDFPWWEM